jgi:membrane protein DedA with SNARE-associated domain
VSEAEIDERRVGMLVAPILALTGLSMLGEALAPSLLVSRPLLLIGLSPLVRHLVLAAPSLDLGPYLVVGVVRLFIGDPLMYLLGRDYGDQAIEMAAGQAGSAGRVFRTVDRLFRRASWPLVLIWPGPLVCALAGAARMPLVPFVSLNLVGTLAMLGLARWSGGQMPDTIKLITAFFERHPYSATIASTSIVALTVLAQVLNRKGQEEDPKTDSPGDAPP